MKKSMLKNLLHSIFLVKQSYIYRLIIVIISVIDDSFLYLLAGQGVYKVPSQVHQEGNRQINSHILNKNIETFFLRLRTIICDIDYGRH